MESGKRGKCCQREKGAEIKESLAPILEREKSLRNKEKKVFLIRQGDAKFCGEERKGEAPSASKLRKILERGHVSQSLRKKIDREKARRLLEKNRRRVKKDGLLGKNRVGKSGETATANKMLEACPISGEYEGPIGYETI